MGETMAEHKGQQSLRGMLEYVLVQLVSWRVQWRTVSAGCRLNGGVFPARLNQAVLAFPTGISGSASWKRGAQKKKAKTLSHQSP